MSECRIHVFLGSAVAGSNNRLGYPKGERHAVIIYSRQAAGTEHDWELAISRAEELGWSEAELKKGGIMSPESLNSLAPENMGAYEDALTKGRAIIVYSEPIEP